MAHNQVEGYAQRKLFAAHWSMEAVTVALEVSLLPLLKLD